MTLRVVDLFCGAGGMSLGLKAAGLQPVYAADWNPHACATYRRNLGPHVELLDLASADPDQLAHKIAEQCGDVDIVAGGPPCQGFSVQRRGANVDSRNDLTLRFARMALALRPKAIIMENVPTILGPRGAGHVTHILESWRDAGFEAETAILEAAAFGVPQMRRRAFIVAVRRGLGPFEFPRPLVRPEDYRTVRQAIGSLPEPPDDFTEHADYPNHRRVDVSAENIRRIQHVPEGGGRLDVPFDLQLPCHRNSNGHRHLDVFGRLWWDRPSGTITAMFDNFTRGRFAHPRSDRNITGREGARLQSFPDEFVFTGPKKEVAKQIGNAVCPQLACAVGHAVLNALQRQPRVVEGPRQCSLPLSLNPAG